MEDTSFFQLLFLSRVKAGWSQASSTRQGTSDEKAAGRVRCRMVKSRVQPDLYPFDSSWPLQANRPCP